MYDILKGLYFIDLMVLISPSILYYWLKYHLKPKNHIKYIHNISPNSYINNNPCNEDHQMTIITLYLSKLHIYWPYEIKYFSIQFDYVLIFQLIYISINNNYFDMFQYHQYYKIIRLFFNYFVNLVIKIVIKLKNNFKIFYPSFLALKYTIILKYFILPLIINKSFISDKFNNNDS